MTEVVIHGPVETNGIFTRCRATVDGKLGWITFPYRAWHVAASGRIG